MLAVVKSRKLEGSSTPLISVDDSEEAHGHADSCPPKLLALAGAVITLVGLGFGLSMPSSLEGKGSTAVHYLSSVIGWTYFAVWSVSFYPQLYLNWARKSVVGLSFDFELYNLVGFAFYSVFNCAFYYDSSVQAAYMAANDGKKNLVQANDVFFALHATFITVLTIAQCFVYERGGQTISRKAGFSICGVCGITLLYFVVVRSSSGGGGGGGGGFFSTLHWLYWLSYVKLGITVVKYIPQVLLNRQRRSTSGWNIYNVLLDFTGGLLSIVQLLLDASVEDDWSGVAGDPVKLGLGMASLVFDVIFMLQHYVWYPQKSASSSSSGVADRDKLGNLVARASASLLEQGAIDITSIDTPQAKRLQALPSSSLTRTLHAVSGESDADTAGADVAKPPMRAPSR